MGTSQSRDSTPEDKVSPGSDNSSIPDIPSPSIVLEQESHELPVEQSHVGQSQVEQPPVEQPQVEQPPVEEPPVEELPVEEPSAPTPDVAVSVSQPTTNSAC